MTRYFWYVSDAKSFKDVLFPRSMSMTILHPPQRLCTVLMDKTNHSPTLRSAIHHKRRYLK